MYGHNIMMNNLYEQTQISVVFLTINSKHFLMEQLMIADTTGL